MSELRPARKSLETVRRARELLQTFYRRQERRREGAPLAWCMAGISSELLAAFELPWEWPENFGTLCAAKQVATRFCEQAEADGFSPFSIHRKLAAWPNLAWGARGFAPF